MTEPSRYSELFALNERSLWNPFTQMREYLAEEPVIIERGEGVHLFDVDGRSYFDGNSSLWLNVHGHNRSELNEAITDQLGRIAHSTLLGMANVPALELADRLRMITPDGLTRTFFSDSGAAAVEVGLKMALAYWRRVGRPGKNRFLTFTNAYHGDTIGAMSVGGIDLFQSEFAPLLFEPLRSTYPYPYRFDGTQDDCVASCLEELHDILESRSESIACCVVEPMVQAAGGMITMPPGFLSVLRRLTREYDVLLLADEVATGFGRTAAMFACDHEEVAPDLLALGKGLTGGYLPVAATMATEEIYEAFLGDHADLRALFHGHSFTGNQLGCAVALASLDLFVSDGLIEHVQGTSVLLTGQLEELAELKHVGEVRQCGLMVGVELVEEPSTGAPYDWQARVGQNVCRRARELGMLTRPLGDVVVLMPPLVSSTEEIGAMVSILRDAIDETTT